MKNIIRYIVKSETTNTILYDGYDKKIAYEIAKCLPGFCAISIQYIKKSGIETA